MVRTSFAAKVTTAENGACSGTVMTRKGNFLSEARTILNVTLDAEPDTAEEDTDEGGGEEEVDMGGGREGGGEGKR